MGTRTFFMAAAYSLEVPQSIADEGAHSSRIVFPITQYLLQDTTRETAAGHEAILFGVTARIIWWRTEFLAPHLLGPFQLGRQQFFFDDFGLLYIHAMLAQFLQNDPGAHTRGTAVHDTMRKALVGQPFLLDQGVEQGFHFFSTFCMRGQSAAQFQARVFASG